MYVLNERNKLNKEKKDNFIRSHVNQDISNSDDKATLTSKGRAAYREKVIDDMDKSLRHKITTSKSNPNNRATSILWMHPDDQDRDNLPPISREYHVNGNAIGNGRITYGSNSFSPSNSEPLRRNSENNEKVETYIEKHNKKQVDKARISRKTYKLPNGKYRIVKRKTTERYSVNPQQVENNAPSTQAAKKSKNRNIKIGAGIAAGSLGATAIAIGGKAIYDRKKYKDYLKSHPKSKLTFKEWKSLKKSNKLNESLNILSLLESYNDGSIEYYQSYYEELDKMYLEEYFDTLVELDLMD